MLRSVALVTHTYQVFGNSFLSSATIGSVGDSYLSSATIGSVGDSYLSSATIGSVGDSYLSSATIGSVGDSYLSSATTLGSVGDQCPFSRSGNIPTTYIETGNLRVTRFFKCVFLCYAHQSNRPP